LEHILALLLKLVLADQVTLSMELSVLNVLINVKLVILLLVPAVVVWILSIAISL